jgi:hypothetical protein
MTRPTPHKLLTAARSAGWPSARLEIDDAGKIVLIVSNDKAEAEPANTWQKFEARHAAEVVAIRQDVPRRKR